METLMLADAVAKGRREGLVALRDRLASSIDGSADVRSLSALAKQLADVLREIDQLPVALEVTPVDEVASRRASRRSASTAV